MNGRWWRPGVISLPEDAGQREHPLGQVFHGLRWLVRLGVAWRTMSNAFPPAMRNLDLTGGCQHS